MEDICAALRDCGESLTQLFGRNVEPRKDGKIPTLIESAETWKLHQDKLSLFGRLEKLNADYEVVRHFGQSQAKEQRLSSITFETLKGHMETGQEVWNWFLNKRFEGNVPPGQMEEFQEQF